MSEETKSSNNFPVLMAAILVVMILFTFRSIHELKTNKQKLADVTEEISKVSNENLELKEKIMDAKSKAYIEKQAIEKLRLTKDGYEIVIVNNKKHAKPVNDNGEIKVEDLNITGDNNEDEHISFKNKLLGILR